MTMPKADFYEITDDGQRIGFELLCEVNGDDLYVYLDGRVTYPTFQPGRFKGEPVTYNKRGEATEYRDYPRNLICTTRA